MESRIIYQKIREKGEAIREIDDMFVKKIEEAIKLKKERDEETQFRQELIVEFDIDTGNESIELIKERIKILKGLREISDNKCIEERRYFCYTDIELKSNRVTVKLIKDWRQVYPEH